LRQRHTAYSYQQYVLYVHDGRAVSVEFPLDIQLTELAFPTMRSANTAALSLSHLFDDFL
jgi:hypothetical protein